MGTIFVLFGHFAIKISRKAIALCVCIYFQLSLNVDVHVLAVCLSVYYYGHLFNAVCTCTFRFLLSFCCGLCYFV